MEQQTKTKGVGIAIGVVAFLSIFFVTMFSQKNASPVAVAPQDQPSAADSSSSVPADSTTVPPATVPKKTASLYKDGTYSATGSYMSPGGPDKVGVTLTISHDIVTDATVVNMAGDNTSDRYQDKFISGYKAYVIGKNISSLNLTRVSGSSLTPQGFDDALAQIKAKAKA